MSKTKKALKRKRNAEANLPTNKKGPGASTTSTTTTTAKSLSSNTSPAPVISLAALASEEEIEITVDTLRALASHPPAIKSRGCKELRTAVYDFRQACTTGANAADTGSSSLSAASSTVSGLTARVEGALVDEKYVDAVVLLAEMRIRGFAPKLGALCRWVRHLDAVSGLSMGPEEQDEETGKQTVGCGVEKGDEKKEQSQQIQGRIKQRSRRTARQLEVLRALDAVLRVTGTADLHPETLRLPPASSDDPLALQKLWDLRSEGWTPSPVREDVLTGRLIQDFCPPGARDKFEVLETTPGPERKPPNLHDAVLYLTQDNTIPLLPSGEAPTITRHRHPQVPNLSLLRDVLSPAECKAIIAATEAVGYLPDAPLRDEEGGGAPSVLAHNVYWVVDQAFHDALWARVSPHIPRAATGDGRAARGINRRFRVYRYVPGAEYRCHFDGAWPPSGVVADPAPGKPERKKYLWDSSSLVEEGGDGKQSSLYTFLLYLNDEFEGGETTFFTPSLREGVMNAHPVRPVMGAVALFPHGESRGALLHEGTGVRRGAKYIIRTDVEFDVEAGA